MMMNVLIKFYFCDILYFSLSWITVPLRQYVYRRDTRESSRTSTVTTVVAKNLSDYIYFDNVFWRNDIETPRKILVQGTK